MSFWGRFRTCQTSAQPVLRLQPESSNLALTAFNGQFWIPGSGRVNRTVGVPREFQLEHPAKPPENAGFSASVLHGYVESGIYGIHWTWVFVLNLYPYHVLNLLCSHVETSRWWLDEPLLQPVNS